MRLKKKRATTLHHFSLTSAALIHFSFIFLLTFFFFSLKGVARHKDPPLEAAQYPGL